MTGYFHVKEDFRILDEILCDNNDNKSNEMATALS